MPYRFELVDFETRPCLSAPTITKLSDLAKVQARWIVAVAAELKAQRLAAAGPAFARYYSYEPEKIVLEIGWPTQGIALNSGKMRAGRLPAGRYLSTNHVGSPVSLDTVFPAARTWLAGQGLKADRGWLEYCLTDPEQEPDVDRWKTRVLIPIKK